VHARVCLSVCVWCVLCWRISAAEGAVRETVRKAQPTRPCDVRHRHRSCSVICCLTRPSGGHQSALLGGGCVRAWRRRHTACQTNKASSDPRRGKDDSSPANQPARPKQTSVCMSGPLSGGADRKPRRLCDWRFPCSPRVTHLTSESGVGPALPLVKCRSTLSQLGGTGEIAAQRWSCHVACDLQRHRGSLFFSACGSAKKTWFCLVSAKAACLCFPGRSFHRTPAVRIIDVPWTF
jgi:hypothetical protein